MLSASKRPLSDGNHANAFGMTLADYAAARGMPARRARAAYTALMREGLGAQMPPVSRCERTIDGLIKFCLPVTTADRSILESESVIVPMRNYRGSRWHTLCVSSQVGCRMGCTFCETGRMGLLRNLAAAEIAQQLVVARRILHKVSPDEAAENASRGGIANVVFMGMGEPFDNLDNVLQAIRVFSDPDGLAVPLSRITVSTVGRIDGLRRLAALVREGKRDWERLRLAISLNAATDRLRNALMPVNKGMPLRELQGALLAFPLARRGRFLIEYVLIKDVNDTVRDAEAVAAWCRPLPCVVNVIPYNPQRGATYETPSEATVIDFLRRLRSHGLFVKRRLTHGRELMGACGQLGNPDRRRLG